MLKRGSTGDDVRVLQAALRSLGFYKPPLSIDGDFGGGTESSVRDFQKSRSLPSTGVVDSATWTAVLGEQLPFASSGDRLADAGQAAFVEAMRLWRSDITDPSARDNSIGAMRSRLAIDEIFKTARESGATPYRGNERGAVQWCGIFAAACWRKAGLDPHWLPTYWRSTWRLRAWASYQDFDAAHPNPRPHTGPHRLIARLDAFSSSLPFEPRAGDVLVVGDGKPEEGDHITIVKSFDPVSRMFETVSGNGGGIGPDGRKREGVVLRDFPLGQRGGVGYFAMYLYRPAPSDIIAP